MRRIIIVLMALAIIINAEDNQTIDKLTVKPYGYLKLDMSYDSDLMSIGNFARWVLSNSSENAIPTTSITAKQSRFGMNITKGDISGKVEIDFYGVGSAENKGGVLLRKAYAEANFDNFTVRAGQDSDVISPLVPSTINYPVAWWAGNIGYRRPMLKVFGSLNSVDWTVALARNIGYDLPKTDNIFESTDGIDDGAAAVLPEIQGRIGFTILENYTIGFSGHYSRQNSIVLTDVIGHTYDNKYLSWSANLDLNLKITPKITLNGETFVGSNIAGMLGGIANASTFDGIDTQGGWVNLKIKPNSKYSLSTGFSMDDPCDCDLSDGARSKNTIVFANIYQDVLEGFLIGFEISYWSTEYKNIDTASALRGQLGFMYKF